MPAGADWPRGEMDNSPGVDLPPYPSGSWSFSSKEEITGSNPVGGTKLGRRSHEDLGVRSREVQGGAAVVNRAGLQNRRETYRRFESCPPCQVLPG